MCTNLLRRSSKKLEEEGIEGEQDLKYSKCRATFDMEVYYPQTHLPDKTEKLEFKAQYALLSISVASNVPSYEEPECFIVQGEGREHALHTMTAFVDHQEKIADKASELELQRFTPLLNTVEETLCPGGIVGYEEESSQASASHREACEEETGESTGFDDDEDDSESEDEETEEDRVFIDKGGRGRTVRPLFLSSPRSTIP